MAFKPKTQTEIYLSDKSPVDRARFAEAIKELGGHPDTKHLVGQFDLYLDTPRARELKCWQFLKAARSLLTPEKNKTWGHLVGIAARVTWIEFQRHEREMAAAAAQKEPETYRSVLDDPDHRPMRMNPDKFSKPHPGRNLKVS